MILIQGAMDIELQYLKKSLNDIKENTINNFVFYTGDLNGNEVVLSKTNIGTIDAAIATTLGIMQFKPDIVINQGIAGAHLDTIHTGDIIIGEKCININSLDMPKSLKGQGSNSLKWKPNKRAKYYNADKNLISMAHDIEYHGGKKIFGTIGSGDIFSREFDRIEWISSMFGNLCEDMETISTYTACERFGIPCIGIRIISNNEITGEELNKEVAIDCQKFVLELIYKINSKI